MVVLTTLPPPTDGIHHQESNTSAYIAAQDLGKGTLYIAESRVSWVSNEGNSGFSLEYPGIGLHAISRDLSVFPRECLYLMVEANLKELCGGQSNSVISSSNGTSPAVNGSAQLLNGETAGDEEDDDEKKSPKFDLFRKIKCLWT